MKVTLKLEALAMFGLGILAFGQLNLPWWWFPALILTPDVGMIGYLINPKIGALTYNLCHHIGVAIVVYVLGIQMQNEVLQCAGIILFSHANLDRIFGYGLKYGTSFHDTHLGTIGNSKI